MVFSSTIFLLLFLPVVVTLYFFSDKKYKNWVLLLSSVFFYSWGGPKFIAVILFTTALDFFLVTRLHDSKSPLQRKLFLILSLFLNLGLLFYFKYCNFFIENVNALFGAVGINEISWTKVVLPIGISFYTFESLTYVIDVYRRVHAPLKNFWEYQLYILFFPKLIAGPIVRYHDISDQLTNRFSTHSSTLIFNGVFRFTVGLAKKVLIANVFAEIADEVYLLPFDQLNSTDAWLGSLAYTFQIYFDFSGYSDMALGLAMIFGFRLPENFNNPYISLSITEFWRRWHISLGSWMRNYLYIPLGGNKVHSKSRLYFNLWVVFLISGLWHGASWSFVFWGVFHGAFLVLERMGLEKVYSKIPIALNLFLVFIIINISWIFFRAETLEQGFAFCASLFSFDFSQSTFRLDEQRIFYYFLAFLFVWVWRSRKFNQWQEKLLNKELSDYFVSKSLLIFFLFFLSLVFVVSSDYNPFIYFRF
jgi:alginate O-acetyltransferase complex protein AlgI